jgi:glucosamine--fructose-6-phosphate aminotransferase (isomerizing)
MSLQSEIEEQPDVLRKVLAENGAVTKAAAGLFRSDDVSHAVVAARGTSDNAARYAKYVWGIRGGLSVALAAPSLYGGYAAPPNLAGSVVVGISQSGQSPDLIAVLEEGCRQGRPTVAVTNAPGSPLADVADVVIPILAGPELSVAATKTYTATLLNVAMIASHLGGGRGEGLEAVAGAVADVVADVRRPREAVERLGPIAGCVVLGRGTNHATAFEWALKLQEMAYVLAHPFSSADFAHGPFAVLEHGFPVLAVAAAGPMLTSTLEQLERSVVERAAQIAVITDQVGLPYPAIPFPEVGEWLSPIPAIVAAQLFTLEMARRRGIDPERPRGLSKVTRTT